MGEKMGKDQHLLFNRALPHGIPLTSPHPEPISFPKRSVEWTITRFWHVLQMSTLLSCSSWLNMDFPEVYQEMLP